MPGIPAGIGYMESVSVSPQKAQLQGDFSPIGGQQGWKGQLEAAGQAVKGERPRLKQSINTFQNPPHPTPASFGRNSSHGKAGRGGGTQRKSHTQPGG